MVQHLTLSASRRALFVRVSGICLSLTALRAMLSLNLSPLRPSHVSCSRCCRGAAGSGTSVVRLISCASDARSQTHVFFRFRRVCVSVVETLSGSAKVDLCFAAISTVTYVASVCCLSVSPFVYSSAWLSFVARSVYLCACLFDRVHC